MAKRISNPGSTPNLAATGRLLFLASTFAMQPDDSLEEAIGPELQVSALEVERCLEKLPHEHKANIRESERIYQGLEFKAAPEDLLKIKGELRNAIETDASPEDIAKLTGYGALWHFLPKEQQSIQYRKMDKRWQHFLKQLRFYAVSHALAESARCAREDRELIAARVMEQVKPNYDDETEIIEVLHSAPEPMEASAYIAAKRAMEHGYNGRFINGSLLHLEHDGPNLYTLNEVKMVVGNGWIQLDGKDIGDLRVRNFGVLPDGVHFYAQPNKEEWCGANGIKGVLGAQHASGLGGGGEGEGNGGGGKGSGDGGKGGLKNKSGIPTTASASTKEQGIGINSWIDSRLASAPEALSPTGSSGELEKEAERQQKEHKAAKAWEKMFATRRAEREAKRVMSRSGKCLIDTVIGWTQLLLDQVDPEAGMAVTKLHGVNTDPLCEHLRKEEHRADAAGLVASLQDCGINWAMLTYEPGSNAQCETWHETRYPEQLQSSKQDYRALCVNLAQPQSAAYAEYKMCGGRFDFGDRVCVNTPVLKGCRWKY